MYVDTRMNLFILMCLQNIALALVTNALGMYTKLELFLFLFGRETEEAYRKIFNVELVFL